MEQNRVKKEPHTYTVHLIYDSADTALDHLINKLYWDRWILTWIKWKKGRNLGLYHTPYKLSMVDRLYVALNVKDTIIKLPDGDII